MLAGAGYSVTTRSAWVGAVTVRDNRQAVGCTLPKFAVGIRGASLLGLSAAFSGPVPQGESRSPECIAGTAVRHSIAQWKPEKMQDKARRSTSSAFPTSNAWEEARNYRCACGY